MMQGGWRRILVFGLATMCFLAPLKFTHPVILYQFAYWPESILDWIFSSWPNVLFGVLLVPWIVIGIGVVRWRELPRIAWLSPLLFLLSQMVSTFAGIDWSASGAVLGLFLSLAAAYFLGAGGIREEDLGVILWAWLAAAVLVVWSGVSQATGGLDEMREFLGTHPELARHQPGLWKKIESNRIFATFVYPNALGGFIASTLWIVAAWLVRRSTQARGRGETAWGACVFALMVEIGLLYCLWKSESKGAYATLVLTAFLAIGLMARRRAPAWSGMAVVGVAAVAAFGWGYGQAAFDKGLKTWDARMGYWKAAWKIGLDHPVLGTGPGTFSKVYPSYKNVDDESTRLVHNNYLQMWSDSGFVGFVAFLLWLPGSLIVWLRRIGASPPGAPRTVHVFLGCACAAFALHSLVDFDLYLLGNAWPIFLLLGYLVGPPKS